MAAWYNPNASVIRALIEAGADVDDYDWAYRTPLHLAAMENKNADVVKVLVEGGADVGAIPVTIVSMAGR